MTSGVAASLAAGVCAADNAESPHATANATTAPRQRAPQLAVPTRRGPITNGARFRMKNNDALPRIDVDPETYEVRADGELLTCEPATVLPMAQRYFLF